MLPQQNLLYELTGVRMGRCVAEIVRLPALRRGGKTKPDAAFCAELEKVLPRQPD